MKLFKVVNHKGAHLVGGLMSMRTYEYESAKKR